MNHNLPEATNEVKALQDEELRAGLNDCSDFTAYKTFLLLHIYGAQAALRFLRGQKPKNL